MLDDKQIELTDTASKCRRICIWLEWWWISVNLTYPFIYWIERKTLGMSSCNQLFATHNVHLHLEVQIKIERERHIERHTCANTYCSFVSIQGLIPALYQHHNDIQYWFQADASNTMSEYRELKWKIRSTVLLGPWRSKKKTKQINKLLHFVRLSFFSLKAVVNIELLSQHIYPTIWRIRFHIKSFRFVYKHFSVCPRAIPTTTTIHSFRIGKSTS